MVGVSCCICCFMSIPVRNSIQQQKVIHIVCVLAVLCHCYLDLNPHANISLRLRTFFWCCQHGLFWSLPQQNKTPQKMQVRKKVRHISMIQRTAHLNAQLKATVFTVAWWLSENKRCPVSTCQTAAVPSSDAVAAKDPDGSNEASSTPRPCFNVSSGAPPTSQTPAELSADAVITREPVWSKAALYTRSLCWKVAVCLLLTRSQTFPAWSSPPETMCIPSLSKAALNTRLLCLAVKIFAPLTTSHTTAVLSNEAVTTLPPKSKAAVIHLSRCFIVMSLAPVDTSQTQAEPSLEAVTKRVPDTSKEAL